MRKTRGWDKTIASELKGQLGLNGIRPSEMLEVELGLFLAGETLTVPHVNDVWGLLTGHNYGQIGLFDEAQRRAVASGRMWLAHLRGKYAWEKALKRYQSIHHALRGYDISADGSFTRRAVTIGAKRFQIYDQTLKTAPAHKIQKRPQAEAGRYRFKTRTSMESITIPADFIFEKVVPHTLIPRTDNPPLTFTWSELIQTARWMDATLQQKYPEQDVRWFKSLSACHLTLGETLTFSSVMNMVGMVSAGKTTLLTVLTVCAARRGLTIGNVLGDVVSILNMVQTLAQFGIAAVPILGRGNRARHINRMHRALSIDTGDHAFLQHEQAFQALSTVCALDSLRDTAKPLSVEDFPCSNLIGEDGNAYTCPVLSVCPVHQVSLSIPSAQVWIATPQSLLYTRVQATLYPEGIVFGEWLYHHANLVLIDEADRVQVTFDREFSPSLTLIGRTQHDSWLSKLETYVDEKLNVFGRSQLKEQEIAIWVNALKMAVAAANQAFSALLQDVSPLQEREQTYFTAWMICDNLAFLLSDEGEDEQKRTRLMALFEAYIDDPLGEHHDDELVPLTQEALTSSNWNVVLDKLGAWLQLQSPTRNEKYLANDRVRLWFAMSIAVLSNRVDLITRGWRLAEAVFGLDDNSKLTFNRPSQDLLFTVPASPMGNVLAYQYVKSTEGPYGDLRFFRSSGVGRQFLLGYHRLYADLGWVGPHTLLLSGTSWAGTSPSYHLPIPVDAVLLPDSSQLERILEGTKFEYLPQLDRENKAIRVSGQMGHHRSHALRALVMGLVKKRNAGFGRAGISQLEQIRQQLQEGQQSILLVVGSYDESRWVVDAIEHERPDWIGNVKRLVPDDDAEERFFSRHQQSSKLSRGMVAKFGTSEAWILVAPLLAIERGHNILNQVGQAALGAVFFLVRPHTRPDDLSYTIHSLNRWALDHTQAFESKQLYETATQFREAAYQRWRQLLHMKMIYTTLPDEEYAAITWSHMITLWQVIGRLLRGGSPARVFFCDAAFMGNEEARRGNMLTSFLDLLQPYFEDPSSLSTDEVIVQALFTPLYEALKSMKGINHGTAL